VHPDDLTRLGIAEGQRVRMGNERGEIVLLAEAFDGVQRGVVIVESIAPNEHFEGGEGINTLTSAFQAAPYGGAAFHDNHVWLQPA
jgi:anaerobic selenocysteine-containing dehydrogenase